MSTFAAVLLALGWSTVAWTSLRPSSDTSGALVQRDLLDVPAAARGGTSASAIDRWGERVRGALQLGPRWPTRVLGLAVPVVVVLVLVDPTLSLAIVAGAVVIEVIGRVTSARARRARMLEELPAVLELLRMAMAAGLTLAAALEVLSREVDGELGGLLREVARRRARGSALAEALDAAGRSEAPPLDGILSLLATAHRSGAPVGEALSRAAARQRTAARVDAQVRARRLPVTMLLPLMTCVLPSFVLLTIVPVLAGGATGLDLP